MNANVEILNHFFPTRLCLNQASRPDRWKQATQEFKRVGLEIDQFLALPGNTPFESFNKSQAAMISCIVDDGEAALTLEDDVVFKETDHLQVALWHLPTDWDILYFGANLFDPAPAKGRPSTEVVVIRPPHILRVDGAWTTHAVAYSARMARYIANHFDPVENGMYDDWLAREVHAKCNCFIINPMIAWQRPGNSDLWGGQTDYTECFRKGNEKMVDAVLFHQTQLKKDTQTFQNK